MSIGNHRPTRLLVDTQAIIDNYQTVKNHLPTGTHIQAVIKADAYGHGAIPVAKALSAYGVDGFCVAVSDEALDLRDNGIQDPLMILGVSEATDAWLHAKQNIGVTITSKDYLEEALSMREAFQGQRLPIHIKIDTGMGRIGFCSADEVQTVIDYIAENETFFELSSLFTHYATADDVSLEDTQLMQAQNDRFHQILDALSFEALDHKPFVHQSNSALSLWHPDFTLDSVRLGIALYGINPSNGAIDLPYPLKPALRLETELVHVKQLPANATISYGATYTTSTDEWIGTLPIGYADGWLRRMADFHVLVDDDLCPFVGRICMDQCMIRLPKAYPTGTKVTLLDAASTAELSAEALAKHASTIGYEITCGFSERIPRIYN